MGCTQSQEKQFSSLDSYTKQTPNGLVITAASDRCEDHFSQKQKELLRETWSVLQPNKQKHGIAVFVQIFTREPRTKQLFPFRDLHDSELLNDPLFCSHSMRFMHAIESTIVNLDALDVALIPILHRLGEKHVHMRGFKQDYFSAFMGSIMEVVEQVLGKDRYTQEVMSAWAQLGNFVAAKMMEGYQNALTDTVDTSVDNIVPNGVPESQGINTSDMINSGTVQNGNHV